MEAGENFEAALRTLIWRWNNDRAGQIADYILQDRITKDRMLPTVDTTAPLTRGMAVPLPEK